MFKRAVFKVSLLSKRTFHKQFKLQRRYISASLSAYLKNELQSIKDGGLYKTERVITSMQGPKITIKGQDGKERSVLNFCANNYLGLADNPQVIQASQQGLNHRGNGLSSVRFICGTQDIHRELELKIAEFHGKDDAILFAACFDANAGVFEALLTAEDGIITDKLNHASIIDGVRLCKAKRYLFEHLDMDSLESCLKTAKEDKVRHTLVVTDGCFSMDGDIAPLDEIRALCTSYDVTLLIDDAHATGFLGKTGRGTEEYFGVKADIINSTLGKALGGAMGGYITSSAEVVDMLRQRARPYLFSNALAPSLVTGALTVFDMIMNDCSLRDKLSENVQNFRLSMKEIGFELMGNFHHPICPVMLKDARLAQVFAEDMLGYGIYVIGFSYPVVPIGLARIRVQISAAHDAEQIKQCVDAFQKVGQKHKLL